MIQAMPDVSPPKWHLAHTTWFFEQFLLMPFAPDYRVFHADYGRLFNSYYETVGALFPRPQRGCLSRPSVADIQRYRAHVDAAMHDLLRHDEAPEIRSRTLLGLHHEQQHQELLLTDIKYNFSVNPLHPAYWDHPPMAGVAPTLSWVACRGGLQDIGCGGDGFAFDNETPRHRVYLEDFRLGSRLVTNREFLDFVDVPVLVREDLLQVVCGLGDGSRRSVAGAVVLGTARWLMVGVYAVGLPSARRA